MAQGMLFALNMLVYGGIATSMIMWTQFLLNRRPSIAGKEGPRLEFVVRRPPFWSVADFLVMFGTFVMATNILAAIFVSQGWLPRPSTPPEIKTAPEIKTGPEIKTAPDVKVAREAKTDVLDIAGDDAARPTDDEPSSTTRGVKRLYGQTVIGILAGSIAFFVALSFAVFAQRDRRSAVAELGLHATRKSVSQGLWGSLWFLPPVLLISFLISQLIRYEHPVLETLKAVAADPSPAGFLLLFAATAVITPVVEEFMFRVLLQGGLQGMFDRVVEDANGNPSWRATSWIPIIMTSVLFAAMHIGQGGAPIALFFLSIGLGYLYRQTGSIVPPLIVHMVLNATTLLVEFTAELTHQPVT